MLSSVVSRRALGFISHGLHKHHKHTSSLKLPKAAGRGLSVDRTQALDEDLHPSITAAKERHVKLSSASKASRDDNAGFSPSDAKVSLNNQGAHSSYFASSEALSNGNRENGHTSISMCDHRLSHSVSESSVCSQDAETQGHEPPSETLDRQEELLSSVHFRANTFTDSSEGLMTQENALLEVQKKMKLLESKHWSPNDVASLLTKKVFTSCTLGQLVAVLRVLGDFYGEKAHHVLIRNPQILLWQIKSLQEKIKLLVDLQIEQVAPHMNVLSMNSKLLVKKMAFFEEIGLIGEARNQVIHKDPYILSLGIQKSTNSSLDFLNSVGITREGVFKICPRVIGVSDINKVIQQYKFFRTMGLSACEFCRILRFSFGLSVEIIEFRIQCIKNLGFSEDDVWAMMKMFPMILTMRPECVKKKVDYLVHEQGKHMTDIVRYPCCLTYSLEGRIIPRFKSLNNARISKEAYKLRTIIGTKDAHFEALVRKKVASLSLNQQQSKLL